MKNRLLAFLLVLCMLFSSLTVLTACGGGGESGGEQGGGESGGGSGEGGSGNGGGSGESGSGNGGGSGEGGSGDKPETARYEVSVKLANGKPLGNVGIFVYNNVEDLNNELPRTYRSLDAQGFVSLDLPKSEDYVISLVITEEGYNCAPYYELEAETSIILTTSVISNPDLSGVRYGTGDVMRDFTVTDTDGAWMIPAGSESIDIMSMSDQQSNVLMMEGMSVLMGALSSLAQANNTLASLISSMM